MATVSRIAGRQLLQASQHCSWKHQRSAITRNPWLSRCLLRQRCPEVAASRRVVSAKNCGRQQPQWEAAGTEIPNTVNEHCQRRAAALKVTWLGAGVNVGLAIVKYGAGTLSGSTALIADAAHSLSDLLSDVVTLLVVEAAWAPPDERHPYGKGRYEAVGSLSVAGVLVCTAGGVGWSSLSVLFDWWAGQPMVSLADSGYGTAAIAACVVSLAAKEALYHVTVKVGKAARSQTLIANAWHHRSDAFSSVAALIGVAGGCSGMPWLDPASGLVVSALVAKAGFEIGWEAIHEVVEKVDPADESRHAIAAITSETSGVLQMRQLRTRKMGPYSLVDLRVEVDPHLSMSAAHNISTHLESRIQNELDGISEVLVHIVPGVVKCKARIRQQDETPDIWKAPIKDSDTRLLRPHGQVEKEVRAALKVVPEIRGVSDVITYYLPNQGIKLKVDIVCDEDLTIREALTIGRKAKEILQELPDVLAIDVDLELPN